MNLRMSYNEDEGTWVVKAEDVELTMDKPELLGSEELQTLCKTTPWNKPGVVVDRLYTIYAQRLENLHLHVQ